MSDICLNVSLAAKHNKAQLCAGRVTTDSASGSDH